MQRSKVLGWRWVIDASDICWVRCPLRTSSSFGGGVCLYTGIAALCRVSCVSTFGPLPVSFSSGRHGGWASSGGGTALDALNRIPSDRHCVRIALEDRTVAGRFGIRSVLLTFNPQSIQHRKP